jgi:hypothetical protein
LSALWITVSGLDAVPLVDAEESASVTGCVDAETVLVVPFVAGATAC